MNEKRKELLTGRARFLWICLVMTALLLMPGCGKKNEYNETSIRILKKGRIENEIIESFGMNYYDAGELRKMLEETVQEYNAGTGEKDRVVLKEVKVEKETADVVLEFQSFSDYAAFNKVDFFCGKISEAILEGFDMRVNLISPDGKRAGEEELKSMTDKSIVILSEPVMVEPLQDIEYVSANVEYLDERHARVSGDSEGLAYIVLKK